MIEKNIFQTHITHDLPPDSRHQVNRLKETNPDWSYTFHDNTEMRDYCHSVGSDVGKAVDAMASGAGKADIWRLAVIYKEGGIYMDLDKRLHYDAPAFSSVILPEDEMIHGRNWHVFGYNAPHSNAVMVAKAGHPIMGNALDSVVHAVNTKTPLLEVGRHKSTKRRDLPDGGCWGGKLEAYTGTPHLWKAMAEHLGFVDMKDGVYDRLRISNCIDRIVTQHDGYGADHVTMKGSHWTTQPVFVDEDKRKTQPILE